MDIESKGKPIFVMLGHPQLGFVPMDGGENDFELARFETVKEAENSAKHSWLGSKFGYRIYSIDH